MVAKPWFQRTILQEGPWNLSFFVDKDSILIKVEIFKSCVDIEMINPWTQVKSYHGHFERSQTIMFNGLNDFLTDGCLSNNFIY